MSKIKLIVEIDEEDYGDFCDWFESVPSSVDGLPCVKGKFNTALYDAKPVDTSGDLISREDLKEKLKERYYNDGLDIVTAIELIDNAPTIEIPVARWDCYCEGQKVGFKKAEDVFERMKLIQETVDCIRNKFNLNTKSNKLVRNCMALVQNAIDGEYHDMEEVDMKGGAK